ncbi:phage terminase, large subunit [Peptoanaerobacter stomatis]|uniref:Phage terminase, large subunit n=1 Tax=Peptoanaerobacter stomatis TaxID=796937 RepID=G9XA56_9FIRM|nr:terminase TerL endonuclease subunit [Peptoanaerobacter stomatis]EHL20302.1 phage terminase, large subunit [Peptoanaerobacter stomatis]
MVKIKEHLSYKYLADVLDGKINAPKYVIKQCEKMRKIYDGKDKIYIIDWHKVDLIDGLLKLMVMPKGFNAGLTIYESLAGFQSFFIISMICTVFRDDKNKRRFKKALLEICRKNGKTFLIAIIFILLFLLEPQFSDFYSVAPDGAISRQIKDMIEQIIFSSPALTDKFTIRRDHILSKLNKSKFIPLNYSNIRLESRLPSVFVVDEVGALPNNYAIEAMESGQLTIKNKLGCVISTKYPKIDNPFEDEVEYAKKVLDGLIDDDGLFALLYEPDDTKNWESNDDILKQANPLALVVDDIMQNLKKKRQIAIEVPSKRENFVTKHCNIIYQGVGTESYIDVQNLYPNRIYTGEFDWEGREVFVGIDFALTTDNCSIVMLAYDKATDTVYSKNFAFIPDGRIEQKTVIEKLDYKEMIKQGYCMACGDDVVDYLFMEDIVLHLEEKYGVTVNQIGYDRYNALSSAQKFTEAGYVTVEVKQTSAVLHRPTKWLEELILNGKYKYEENRLLEINFANARCNYDSNLNRFVNKKRSTGKIDMVVANIIALCLLQIHLDSQITWVSQSI